MDHPDIYGQQRPPAAFKPGANNTIISGPKPMSGGGGNLASGGGGPAPTCAKGKIPAWQDIPAPAKWICIDDDGGAGDF